MALDDLQDVLVDRVGAPLGAALGRLTHGLI